MNAVDQQVLALTSIFPTHDQSVIRMALEVNGYHTERSTSWLLEMNTAQTPSGKSQNVTQPQTTTHTTILESSESILPPNFLRLPGMEHYTSASQFQPRRKSVTIPTAAASTNRANHPTTATVTAASRAQDSNSDTVETGSLDDASRVDSVGVEVGVGMVVGDEDEEEDEDEDDDDDDESESGEDEDGLLFRP